MKDLPIHKRPFHAFLSHAHADKGLVDRLDYYLNELAAIPIWYDSRNLPPSVQIASQLPEAVAQCRALILVLSHAAVKSGWVREEYNVAVAQRARYKDYRIIPILLEKCEVPGFLETTKWIDLADGKLDLAAYDELLGALYYDSSESEAGATHDVYISRSWRSREAELPDYVCKRLIKAGFRLIGDSQDQSGFAEGQRVESIIASCGGLVAILPDRGGGATSSYMLDEVAIARRLQRPWLIVAEPTVQLPAELEGLAVRLSANELGAAAVEARLEDGLELLAESWQPPVQPHYVFYGTDLADESKMRNQAVKNLIRRVTAMPCIMGEEIREGAIQQVITERICQAFLVIADISEDNLNTCIEAGIARGAGTRYHLVARAPRRRPPFMFRDQQVWFYENELELLSKIHRIIHPYRRRVLNYELQG